MRQLSDVLKAQLYAQESDDPFLLLVTISHPDITTLRLVNNSENIISRGETFVSFPMQITLPVDDGETAREVAISFDNVSLELIEEIRLITDPLDVTIEAVLASNPDFVEIELSELKIRNITYNQSTISAKLSFDDFLNTELSSEKYTSTNFPGLFT